MIATINTLRKRTVGSFFNLLGNLKNKNSKLEFDHFLQKGETEVRPLAIHKQKKSKPKMSKMQQSGKLGLEKRISNKAENT